MPHLTQDIFVASTTSTAVNLEQSNWVPYAISHADSEQISCCAAHYTSSLWNVQAGSSSQYPSLIGTIFPACDSLYHLSWNNLDEFCCHSIAVVSDHVIG
jgi:hypothetical protein